MTGPVIKRTVNVEPIGILEEAIDEFLESGARPRTIISSLIKTATAVELLLKEKLETICPALVLDSIDKEGLQIAAVYKLSNKMLHPKELDSIEIKTARFPILLDRCAKFFDFKSSIPDLLKFHKIRNSLVHHRSQIDMLEVNLLLIQKVFPFLEALTKDDKSFKFRIPPDTWKKLRELEKTCISLLANDLAKKLVYHAKLANKISPARLALRLKSKPELESKDEDVIEDRLKCPACMNETLSCFRVFGVDYDDGLQTGYLYLFMRCKVCDVEIDQDEIEYIIEHFNEFFGKGQEEEQRYWKKAIEPDPPYEY